MKLKFVTGLLFCCGLTTAGVCWLLQPQPARAADSAEYDFGKKVLIVATKPTDPKEVSGGTYLEEAKVRKLGDRLFLVGKIPDLGAEYANSKGTVMWTPISEIIQISEYSDVEALKKVFEEVDKAKKNDMTR